jgi:hypothetical protein
MKAAPAKRNRIGRRDHMRSGERVSRACRADCQCTGPVGIGVRQLLDGIGDPAPGRGTIAIAFGFEAVGARGASVGALSPKRLSISSAARQMSISEITGRQQRGVIEKRLANLATRGTGCFA